MSLGEYLGAGSSITKGLYYFNGNANDSSGNLYNGTPTNISWVGGKIGSGSVSSNGVNSNINVGTQNLGTGNYTFSFWVKTPGKSGTASNPIIDYKIANSNNDRLFINIYGASDGGKLILFARSLLGQTVYRITNFVFNDNKRHNVVCTINISTTASINLYVDGSLNQQPQVGSTLSAIDTNGFYFLSTHDLSYSFLGNIDETIIENRIWSANEVRKYYTFSQGKFIL